MFGCDTHGRVRTFGLGPCPTQVFGKKNNKCDEQHAFDMEKLRNDVREDIRNEFADKFAHIERYCARLETYIHNMGSPVPKSPNGQSVHVQVIHISSYSYICGYY